MKYLANEETIIDRITEAVIDHRLPPGTKLSETVLCEAFGVGRMRIRHTLLLLANSNIVDLRSNRGAFISSPTQRQAREVFDARRAIEPNVCAIAAERATDHEIRRLARHVGAEQAALEAGDRRSAIRLSGLFHAELAEISNNPILARIVMEMVTRTSLIIGMFGAAGTTIFPIDGHTKLLGAIRRKQRHAAAKQMIVHLDHIEEQVNLLFNRETSVDLIEVFGQKAGVVESLGSPA